MSCSNKIFLLIAIIFLTFNIKSQISITNSDFSSLSSTHVFSEVSIDQSLDFQSTGQNYNWDLLSHFSFFSYEVNPVDGQALTTHGWSTSSAVNAALNSGNTKVTLTVTLFSDHSTFFNNPSAQQTLISNLINLVQSRGAHGVNIDIEGLPSAYKTDFANFMVDLCLQMHSAIPDSEVSTVLYAVDWNNVFDFSIMEPYVDHYIVMGYAYYYQGSSSAGPCDPLYHFGSTYNYSISKILRYFIFSKIFSVFSIIIFLRFCYLVFQINKSMKWFTLSFSVFFRTYKRSSHREF